MRFPSRGLLWVCALSLLLLGFQPLLGFAKDAVEPKAKEVQTSSSLTLIEQKRRLLESMLESLDRKAANHKGAILPGLQETKELMARAIIACDVGDKKLAEALLDKGFVLATGLARWVGSSEPSQAQRHRTYGQLRESVRHFREALAVAAREKNLTDAITNISTLERLERQAAKLAALGDLEGANKMLTSAYKIAAENLAHVREGDTVVLRLVFATPEEEYRYELNRYQTHQLLVNLVLKERPLKGDIVREVKNDLAKAEIFHQEANDQGRKGSFDRAIQAEESAVEFLIYALQKAGIYLPK